MTNPLLLLRQWWRSPSPYAELTDYLHRRGLYVVLRLIIMGMAALLGCIPIVMLFSPFGPQSSFWRGIDIACFITALIWTLIWAIRPPRSELVSAIFSVTATMMISLSAAADSDPLAGIYGLNALVMIAVYIGAFHGPKVIALYYAVAAIALVALSVPLLTSGGWAITAAKTLVTGALVLGTPPAIQLAQRVLTIDAAASAIDPLTQLANRRGFHTDASVLLSRTREKGGSISVLMIDIDRFKQVNDRYGHAAGDTVISTCGAIAAAAAGPEATVGRVGGEEFCVATALPPEQAVTIALRICADLARSPLPSTVTCSIGIAGAAVGPHSGGTVSLTTLIDRADTAMYKAKHRGGNGVVVAAT